MDRRWLIEEKKRQIRFTCSGLLGATVTQNNFIHYDVENQNNSRSYARTDKQIAEAISLQNYAAENTSKSNA